MGKAFDTPRETLLLFVSCLVAVPNFLFGKSVHAIRNTQTQTHTHTQTGKSLAWIISQTSKVRFLELALLL